MLRVARVVTVDLSVNSVRSTYSGRCLQAVREVRHPATAQRSRQIQTQQYGEVRLRCRRNPFARQIPFKSVWLSGLAFRRGLAIWRQPILRRG